MERERERERERREREREREREMQYIFTGLGAARENRRVLLPFSLLF
jgi:hypothetical protein